MTSLTENLSARLPRPDRYAAHLDMILGPDKPRRRRPTDFQVVLVALLILLCVGVVLG